ncbi:RNA binding (RRM/RBD/RNP motif) family protein [Forsythia ovata]|uniref:RNA binding (RRM/RBD/RNP motif) family protein n=1 Tax=Forsythia ovata TaxID=205694 RepID=A0ABD1T730_9LAMI
MAEKDETEGRCPACRTPYNKEKIVGMGANCERLVSEMNMEKKLKSQKGKSKTSEGRKQLSSVRVIQRNLVYIVGLPLNLADEDLLQCKEYFGQYGKVLKVSISRTAAGAIQHFTNSTCSVYITYSKEEEAVRCIQSVHGFVLEGRSLRACFGTTKYCHAWLRNVPCSNPDCLYLHEIGSQEDSFTKDEILSAYTRSRVQQITDATNSMQRRSGSMLPPPAEEYCNNSSASGKPSSKTATCTNNSVSSVGASAPNSRSTSLPAGALWGIRATNSQHASTSIPCSTGTLKQKPDGCNGPVIFSTPVASPSQVSSLHGITGKKFDPSEESNTTQQNIKLETVEPLKTDNIITASESFPTSALPVTSPINRQLRGQPPSEDKGIYASNLPNTTKLFDLSDKDSLDATDGNVENVSSNILSTSIARHQQLQNGYSEHFREPLTCQLPGKSANSTDEVCATYIQSDLRSGMQTKVLQIDSREILDDLLSFNSKRLEDPEVVANRRHIPDFSHSSSLSKHSSFHSSQHNVSDGAISVDVHGKILNKNGNLIVPALSGPVMSNGHPDNLFNTSSELVDNREYSYLFPNKDNGLLLERYEREVSSGGRDASDDIGESSIISNILSLDLDSWDEPLSSPQNLAKLLGETDKQRGAFGVPSALKVQSSNQSRFSFAREEEPRSQVSSIEPSINYVEQSFKQLPFVHDSTTKNFHLEKFGNYNGFSAFNGVESDIFASSRSHLSSNKLSFSKPQISAPPGFSVPSRAPPPGFTYNERTEQIWDTHSGNHVLDASSLSKNQYQAPPSSNNINNGDIEFMDPAILAVGKGMLPGGLNGPSLDMRSNFSPQLTTFEEARLHALLHRSLPLHQNQRFTEVGGGFSSLGNAYGIPSGVMEQTLVNNLSPFSQFTIPQSRTAITSNGQWDGWNEVQGGNKLGMSELLRNERLGFDKFYSGHEDSKIRMPSSGNLYNGTYGI